ncbi:type II secretion system F family protein [Streptomyces ficellus]|uniref:Type II secretion system F family protein n=1 Tax=Streptomyces ficellus TaxID=1977088 RepID=A0ABT7Z9J6_9ACTN|nr:type II secretion system F family protein [Streptomyces ficellus]MDN3296165.1 type II secretion system F family protein [Streptomyces ficellus]
MLTVLASAGWVCWTVAARRRERRVRGRIAALLGAELGRHRTWRPEYGTWVGKWAAPLGAAITGWVLVEGVAGCAVGAAAAYGVRKWQRRPRPAGDDGGEVAHRLPLAADLLAACLSAGAAPREAAEAVGESLGGPVGDRLARAAAELRLGGEPAEAWGRFGEIPGARPLARCLERASASGAPAADAVSRLAAGLRAEQARQATARAQRAQVLITAPVGLCFLPAFLAVGVAPVVIGLASELL